MRNTLLAGVLVFAMAGIANAGTITLQPPKSLAKDTTLSELYPTTNYGGATRLTTGSESSPFDEYYTLVEFTGLNVVPSNATVSSATLSLYLYSGRSGDLSLSAYEITSSWDESTVTWNTKPSIATTAEDTTVVGFNHRWYTWDLTSLAQDWVDGTKTNYGVAIHNGGSPHYKWFRSGEYSQDHLGLSRYRPKLDISYTVNVVPLPPAAWLGLGLLGSIGLVRRLRRRRAAF